MYMIGLRDINDTSYGYIWCKLLLKKTSLYYQWQQSQSPNVLKAIRTTTAAWDNVGSFCFGNCFSKAGFSLSLNSKDGVNAEDGMPLSCLVHVPLSASSAHDSDDDIPLAELAKRLTPAGITFTDLVTAYTGLIMT